MENQEHFGRLTDRMATFREEVLEEKPYIDAERAVLATQAYKENQNQPRVMVRALMLQKILENMSIYIEDKSLIAGNQATKNKNAPIFPEYTMEFVMNELDLFEKRDGDVFYITEETKQQLRDIAPFWENNNLRARGEALLPDEVSVFMETGVFGMEGKLNAGDAHLAVNYERILAEGLKGYEERTKKLKAALDFTKPESIDKNVFYKAVLIVIDAVHTFANRYSKLAQDMALTETDAKRKEELLEISRICAKVPYEPASSFREAVQAVWFIQLILQIESNGHSLSYGRFDQYMYPYYMKDINEGKITKEDALELLTCLWIKTLTINKVRSQSHTLSSAGSPMYQNVTIGGQTTDKKDAVNELSFVVLQSVAQTRLTQPNLTVRYHANIDKHFFDECIEVMKLGFGMPALNNDEIIIPSFINWGVKEEDAYNYSAIGCVETAVPGKWGYRCTGMSYINFPRVLLCAMNDGVDLTSGKRFTKGYGKFTEMETYEDLLAAWDKTVREMTRYSVIVENAIDKASERDVPDVLCSALTDDCIGRGKTIKEGGAVYDFISGLQVGIANMADSLAAIKKLVYEEKKITKEQLWNAILDDFQSEENKKIQEMLINDVPKYGNDDDRADDIAVWLLQTFMKKLEKFHTYRDSEPTTSILTITSNVVYGKATGSLPDGRKAGEPLSPGANPSYGAEQNGLLASLNSVAKLPYEWALDGISNTQTINPDALGHSEEERINNLVNVMDGYFAQGAHHLNVNVFGVEKLIDAMEHPEKEEYANFTIRVSGYAVKFISLTKEQQLDVIARTCHDRM